MSFLPIAVLAYVLNAGGIVIDKILIKNSLSNPVTYTFFVSVLQLLILVLIPFGFTLNFDNAFYLAVASGIISVFGLLTFYYSLLKNEASVVGPIVGVFNPLSAFILGWLILSQSLSPTQTIAFIILIFGAIILTLNFWQKSLKSFSKNFFWMAFSGLLFGISYVLLRQSYLSTSFLNGLIISRTAAGIFALSFLILPNLRQQIFSKGPHRSSINSKSTLVLLMIGQTMGALSGLLITFGVSLASPALVNSVFGIQYVIILAAALILKENHPHLLEESLSKKSIAQKIAGAIILSIGLFLLSK